MSCCCFSFDMKVSGGDPAVEMVLQVTQLCCFPFAVDSQEEMLDQVQM